MEQAAQTAKRKVSFSGVQPTGVMTLGNYLGAIRNWVALQQDYDCVYCIVDQHAITIRQEPKTLRKNSLDAYALIMACGIDPERSITFIQSTVPEHAQLEWVLACFTQFGELSRMTQFKDKAARHSDNVNAGLFTYPVLQAADILLYQADVVPVGADQKQHIELSRDIAIRFNNTCGETFVVPEAYIPKESAKIMSLAEPEKKMSKSDANPRAYVSLLDPPDIIMKKFRSAVTDSESQVAYRDGKDGINNLMGLYSAFTGLGIPAIEAEFAGKGYGDFKTAVGEAVVEGLRPIQQEFARLQQDKAYLEQCYRQGAEKAAAVARKTLRKAYKKVGFIEL